MKPLAITVVLSGILQAIAPTPLQAVEYFVSKHGNDANDGRTATTAFFTIQRGLDAIRPGDTLTIGPGEYHESVKRADLGTVEAETTVRAAIPGTAVLRGDVPAPMFAPVRGKRFVHATAFDRDPVAVLEVDTLKTLSRSLDLNALEFEPGSFFYDANARMLYLSSSDLRPPTLNRYAISITATNGLLLTNPVGVMIEGLVVRGYHPDAHKSYVTTNYIGGMVLHQPVGCVVRNCTVLFNGQGVCMVGGRDNIIEHCVGYQNGSPFHNQGGNFIRYNTNNDIIRHNLSYASRGESIKFYSGFTGPALLEGNISWGTWADYYIKGDKAQEHGLAKNNIGLSTFVVHNVSHNLVGDQNQYNRSMTGDNVILAGVDRDAEFADHLNLDFRLQATSTLRGTGPDGVDRGAYPFTPTVFYVAPTGDDSRDGLSVGQAWRTLDHAFGRLKGGDTLYLLEGTYSTTKSLRTVGGQPLFIRGRGTGVVRIKSTMAIADCRDVTLERVHFMEEVTVADSRSIAFNNCGFYSPTVGLGIDRTAGVRVTHSEFTGFSHAGIAITHAAEDVFLSGNIFDNTSSPAVATEHSPDVIYSDYNCYRRAEDAWKVGTAAIALPAVKRLALEKHATVIEPVYVQTGDMPKLGNRDVFASLGAHARPAGFAPTFPQREIGFAGPFLHSVSDTTANIEWWTSAMAQCEVEWGSTPDSTQTKKLFVKGFGSLSLTGLTPGKSYHLRIKRVDPSISPIPDRNFYLEHLGATAIGSKSYVHTLPLEPQAATVSFTTNATATEPRVYYVAPDGDDRRSGLTRQDAWRSVNHAASVVNAGDTVLIAGGTYAEAVRLRVSGDADRPVRFTPVPGEKVTFNGNNGILSNAFIINGKRNIHIDGFYFSAFAFAGGFPSSIFAYMSDDIRITRCFMDGRDTAYNSPFLEAWACSNLLMRNCVVMQAMNTAIGINNSTDSIIEHCVFFRNFTGHGTFVNRAEQKTRITRNVFTDLTIGKENVRLFEVPMMDSFIQSHNCYYLRPREDERPRVFHFYKSTGFMTLAEYFQATGANDSVACDPGFKGAARIAEKDRKPFVPDAMIRLRPLDFSDMFITEPSLVAQNIGLQPEAFADFHFNK